MDPYLPSSCYRFRQTVVGGHFYRVFANARRHASEDTAISVADARKGIRRAYDEFESSVLDVALAPLPHHGNRVPHRYGELRGKRIDQADCRQAEPARHEPNVYTA